MCNMGRLELELLNVGDGGGFDDVKSSNRMNQHNDPWIKIRGYTWQVHFTA